MSQAIKYKFGLIGKSLSHSFSKDYHNRRFSETLPTARYDLYELGSAGEICELIRREPLLCGLNVTIPYKESVIPFLDVLDDKAARIGAVNTISCANGELKGYNTDVDGFTGSLRPLLGAEPIKALVFGTGGAAKAVAEGLREMSIPFQFVSRRHRNERITYVDVTPEMIGAHLLLVNCTPLGMAPEESSYLPIPYGAITPAHIAFDVVYNPGKTVFLARSEAMGANCKNGLEMLHLQADRAWEIWRQHL